VNTIEAFEKDILLQVKFLKTLKIKQQIPKINQKQTIFLWKRRFICSSFIG